VDGKAKMGWDGMGWDGMGWDGMGIARGAGKYLISALGMTNEECAIVVMMRRAFGDGLMRMCCPGGGLCIEYVQYLVQDHKPWWNHFFACACNVPC
jgi:hypothetical protein